MEVYKSETREVVSRFLDRRLSFSNCIAALDAAFARLIPRLNGEELVALRIEMLANNEVVMKESHYLSERRITMKTIRRRLRKLEERFVPRVAPADGWNGKEELLTRLRRMAATEHGGHSMPECGPPVEVARQRVEEYLGKLARGGRI